MNFLTVCLNPVLQRTYILSALREDQVNRALSFCVSASGKGINVTRVLHQLGESVVHLTQAGGIFRDYFLELALQDGLRVEWVDSRSEIRTCATLLSSEAHSSTEIVEEAQEVGIHTEAGIRERFQELLPQADMLIVSGTKAPGFSTDLFPWMTAAAKQLGKKVLLDFRGPDLSSSLSHCPDLIKPNRSEFEETFFPKETHPEEKAVCERMLSLSKAGTEVILTNGPEPVLFTNLGKIHLVSTPKIFPVNTIGSGDAFSAGLASAWIQRYNLPEAVHQGIRCAQQNALQLRPGVIHS